MNKRFLLVQLCTLIEGQSVCMYSGGYQRGKILVGWVGDAVYTQHSFTLASCSDVPCTFTSTDNTGILHQGFAIKCFCFSVAGHTPSWKEEERRDAESTTEYEEGTASILKVDSSHVASSCTCVNFDE